MSGRIRSRRQAAAARQKRKGTALPGVLSDGWTPIEEPERTPRTHTSTMQGADDPRYGSARWQRLRSKVLREHPQCQGECGGFYRSRYADHIVEVRDDASDANFFDETNIAALCGKCHWRKTKRAEARRKGLPEPKLGPVDCGVDAATGLPLSPGHWWNQ
jgi:5-methylcytosine-specific restriction endonuclease McrA